MHYPSFQTFDRLARQGNLVPLCREILADTETPVTALMKLSGGRHTFLLESMEGGEKWGRYSFIGADPHSTFAVLGDDVIIENKTGRLATPHRGDPLGLLRQFLGRFRPVNVPGLPRFYGGAVGYFSYDMIRHFENLPSQAPDDLGTADALFVFTDGMLIFDNLRHTMMVVSSVRIEESATLREAYGRGIATIDGIIDSLSRPLAARRSSAPAADPAPSSNVARERYMEMVATAREYIHRGDAIQVVLSQRFRDSLRSSPIDLYRALRYINPSPYLFHLAFDDVILIGSSPEVMVRLEEGLVELRPIAGTRRRGTTEQEDRRLADELLQDPKERAEHVMLVDLGRNDLGRVAETGSVQVTKLMEVERYSHVMHLVSNVQAHTAPGMDCFDVIKAAFPAGTLTGAPKIRAMEIIDELEPTRRGPYGGAVGYISYSGNMDLCITIRTIMLAGESLYVQTGAGIVAESDPQKEYEETVSKAAGMMEAIRLAASDFHLPGPETEA
ncbi:MAG: anthranilate synthase component I [Deltaproteobacteria bacterium]|nr:anthranilate synthase component I [Deltaproteobacteria bacterium]